MVDLAPVAELFKSTHSDDWNNDFSLQDPESRATEASRKSVDKKKTNFTLANAMT